MGGVATGRGGLHRSRCRSRGAGRSPGPVLSCSIDRQPCFFLLPARLTHRVGLVRTWLSVFMLQGIEGAPWQDVAFCRFIGEGAKQVRASGPTA